MDSSELLKKEFRSTVRQLPTIQDIYSLPPGKPEWLEVKTKEYTLKGIEDPNFKFLEGEVVLDPGKADLTRRVMDRFGKFTDKRVTITTPKGSKIVLSEKSDNIPYKRNRETGYDYVEVVRGGCGKLYHIYIVPKDNLYELNPTALAISSRKLRSFEIKSLQTWSRGKLFLCVIPFNPNRKYNYEATVILATKQGMDYTKESEEYLRTLIEKEILPPVEHLNHIEGNLVVGDETASIEVYLPINEYPISQSSKKEDAEVLGLQTQ